MAREGPAGLRLQVRASRERLAQSGELSQDKADFYTAAEVSLSAASEFMLRYADLAAEMGRAAPSSAKRGRELEEMAQICRHLARQPPRTYWQAMQSVAFLFVLLQIESNASSFSPGRFDQYVMPYLRRDLEAGTL